MGAVALDYIDYVLPPEGIAVELARIARHPYVACENEAREGHAGHAQVVEIVRRATGVDFSQYKANTLHRRITRRMMLHRMETERDYEEHLRRTPAEVEELYQDLLVGVTSFFRDPEAYEALAREVFPRLIAACPPGEAVRCWVVGCSSGEEAYSLAIVFSECAEAAGSGARLQLFATDVNPRCVEKARAGWYPRSIERDVSSVRLRRFFGEEGGGYRIQKSIRECCVFSRHNALIDPPFLRTDFLSCRNLLIYLEPTLQGHLLSLFHFALEPGGSLWLGSSESAGTVRDLFDPTDARHKVFARRAGGRTPSARLSPSLSSLAMHEPAHARSAPLGGLSRDAERLLLAKYAPPGVVVSAGLEIVQFQGDTGPYLAPAAGAASLHLLKMLREGLSTAVRDALGRAEGSGTSVRVENLRVRSDDGFRTLAIEVIPVKAGAAAKGSGFVVLFDEASRQGQTAGARGWLRGWWKKMRGPTGSPPSEEQAKELLHLTQELAATRETLQASAEQHEAANEELQSANEEAQSANEEMQSIYEELESSKEAIEASNKELRALGDKLARRNAELSRLNSELRESEARFRALAQNIPQFAWTANPDGFIHWYNQRWYEYTGTTPEEMEGWGWQRVHNPRELPKVLERWRASITTGESFEMVFPLRGADGQFRPFLTRVHPLKDAEGRVQQWMGTNTDVGELMRSEAALRLSEQRFRTAVSIVSSLIWTNDAEGMMEGPQPGWGNFTGQTEAEYQGYGWAKAVHPEDAQPTVDAWNQAVAQKRLFEFEHRVRRADGAWRLCSIRAVPLLGEDGSILEWVGVHTDITERRRAQTNLEFLASITEDLVRLGSMDEIMRTVGAKIGAHFRLSLVNFIEIHEAAGETVVTHEWHRNDLPSTVGTYKLAEWVTPNFLETCRAGQVFVVCDTATDPRTDAARHTALAVRAYVSVPLVLAGELNALITLHDSAPRDWQEDEVVSMREAADRIWARLERLRVEESARENAALFSTLIEQAPGGVYVIDHAFRVKEVNAQGRPVFAHAEPVIGRDLSEVMEILWGAEVGGEITAIFRHTLETGERYVAPAFTAPRDDLGVEQAYEWEVQRITLPNGRHGVVCYFTDTTERRALEAALRASEQRATGVIQSIADGFITLDTEWRITYLSSRGAEILAPLQKTTSNVLGKVFWGRISRDRRHDLRGELPVRPARAEIRPVRSALCAAEQLVRRPRRIPRPADSPCIFLDVSERKNAEQALAAQTAALRAADRSKDEFLAMLAHELRNPLAPLRNAAEILKIENATAEERTQAQVIIGRQIEKHEPDARRSARRFAHHRRQDRAAQKTRGIGGHPHRRRQHGAGRLRHAPAGSHRLAARGAGLPRSGCHPLGAGLRQPAGQRLQIQRQRLPYRAERRADRAPRCAGSPRHRARQRRGHRRGTAAAHLRSFRAGQPHA